MGFWDIFKKKPVPVTVTEIMAKDHDLAREVDAIATALGTAAKSSANSAPAAVAEQQGHAALQRLLVAFEAHLSPGAKVGIKKKLTMAVLSLISLGASAVAYKLGLPIELVSEAIKAIVVLAVTYIGIEGALDFKGLPKNDPKA